MEHRTASDSTNLFDVIHDIGNAVVDYDLDHFLRGSITSLPRWIVADSLECLEVSALRNAKGTSRIHGAQPDPLSVRRYKGSGVDGKNIVFQISIMPCVKQPKESVFLCPHKNLAVQEVVPIGRRDAARKRDCETRRWHRLLVSDDDLVTRGSHSDLFGTMLPLESQSVLTFHPIKIQNCRSAK